MSKREAVKRNLNARMEMVLSFLNTIYLGEETFTGAWHKIISAVKVLIISARKFLKDDCVTKASSITYTIILSLVPMLAVALTVYSLYYGVGKNKKELFDRILLLMAEYNITMNIDPIFDVILGLVDNAGKIGGISAAIMIFSATAMFRSLEKSLNDIWKVRKGRPLFLKIVYYWAALTLGPIMLAAGMYVATQLSSVLSSPNYSAAAAAGGRVWVVGSKSVILIKDAAKDAFRPIHAGGGAVDFENQKVYAYDPGGRSFVARDALVEPRDLKKTRFGGVRFAGRKGWIVGSGGIMLHTADGGRTWRIRKFGSFNFNDIYMADEARGFIAAESGRILKTKDGGTSWDVEEYEGQPNFTAISFFRGRGIITGSRGVILTTDNGGETWELRQIIEARRRDRYADINGAFFINGRQVWLVGSGGLLLHSGDGGASWTSKKFRDTDYHAAYFFSPLEGVVGGDRGALIRTTNGGESWEREELPTLRVNSFMYRNGRLLAICDAGTILSSSDRGASWKPVAEGRKFGYTLINFLAPFVIIWLLFLLAYRTLPNTRVPFKPAALGAAFTGAVWVIFILAFIVYVKAFATGTFAVYGALAAIPLFLLIVFASSIIILYGAEVAYTLMHPETYRSLKKAFRDREELHAYYGIALLQQIYRTFESGGGASSLKDLRKALAGRPDEIDRYIGLFLDAKLIIQNDDDRFLPSNSSDNVMINDVIDSILHISLDMPVPVGTSPSRRLLAGLFNRITLSRRNTVGKVTLKELIDTAP